MFKKIKEFFVGKPATAAQPQLVSAPYKLPEPPAVTIIPLVPTVLPEVKAEPVAAEIATPVKKPRKPRTPKAVVAEKPVKTVKEKAPAKARAPKTAPKLTVVKSSKSKKV
jgi:hypothetical protein